MDAARKITVSNLLKLRECAEKKRIFSLSLKGNTGQDRILLISKVLTVIKTDMYYEKGFDTTMRDAEKCLREGYQKEWEPLQVSLKLTLHKELEKIKRLIVYLFSKDMTIVDIDVPYEIRLPGISYHGEKFDAILGNADLVVKMGNAYEAIRFSTKMSTYSYAARKDTSKPENAPELILMKLGLEGRFRGIKCSMYYMKGKDDKDSMFPPFEVKRGKNIIQQDFAGKDAKSILRHLYDVMAMKMDASCDDCIQKSVCQFKRKANCPEESNQGQRIKADGSHSKKKPSYTGAQVAVIKHKDGPMNVIAVPGAGKTFSLVQRMLFLIKEEGIHPNQILFVTFTRKACEEIKNRVIKALGTNEESALPRIFTFNALGYEILKDNPALIGRRVKLAGSIDKLSIIRQVLESIPIIKGVSYDGIYMKYGLIKRLDKEFLKIEEKGVDFWSEQTKWIDPEGVIAAYRKYCNIFADRGLVTYDMQISLCNELFEKHPELAKLYSKAFSYIMVDEFQDVSADNAEMIYKIAKYHENIVVVGDDDQSIYSFRGGSNVFMLKFADDFPKAKTVIMNDNFRSNDKILEASEELISNNTDRFEKNMIPHGNVEGRPVFLKGFLNKDLPEIVSGYIKKGYRPGDIAILGRYNKTLFQATEYLHLYFPVNAPKDYLIDDAVFGAVYDILNVYFNGFDQDDSIYRLFARLGYEMEMSKSKRSESLIQNIVHETGLPELDLKSADVIRYYEELALEGVPCAVKKVFQCLKSIQYEKNLSALIAGITKIIFDISEYQVTDILSEMTDERAIAAPKDLFYLMQDMILFSDETRIGYENQNAIHLLTAHDAKGKEFPVVIVHSVDEFGDTEEERRLLYVAMTRAQETLLVTESMNQNSRLMKECAEKMAVNESA